jgi:cobalt/nickel transport system permease protein
LTIFTPLNNKTNGMTVMKTVIIKSILSMFILTLLSASTSFQYLLKGLERLKFPKIFVLLLSFMYRYIFVLIEEKQAIERIIKSKYFGKKFFLQYRILGNIIGSLFISTYDKAERIYTSMCSRLFSGQIQTLNELKITYSDILFCIILSTITGLIRLTL